MGLETVHPDVLPRLNKRMTLDDVPPRARGSGAIGGIALRAFVLVGRRGWTRTKRSSWARRSIDFAFDCGAERSRSSRRARATAPWRPCARAGDFASRRARLPREPRATGLASGGGRVFADLWDLDALADLRRVRRARAARACRAMNLRQTAPPLRWPAAACGAGVTGPIRRRGHRLRLRRLARRRSLRRRLGRSVVLLERGPASRASPSASRPRRSPTCCSRSSADRYDLPRIRPLSAWGTWQRASPGDRLRAEARASPSTVTSRPAVRRAIPTAAISSSSRRARTTRSPTRTGIARTSTSSSPARPQREGAEFSIGRGSPGSAPSPGGCDVEAMRAGSPARAQSAASSSTPRDRAAFLHRGLGLGAAAFPGLPRDRGAVSRTSRACGGWTSRDSSRPTTGRPTRRTTRRCITSSTAAGSGCSASTTASRAPGSPRRRSSRGTWASRKARRPGTGCSDRFPTVREQFADARAGHCRSSTAGASPSAARRPPDRVGRCCRPRRRSSIPCSRPGFPLTLLGPASAGRRRCAPTGGGRDSRTRCGATRERTFLEVDAGRAPRLRAVRPHSADFPVFAALTKLYFAAASYAEGARRLGRPELAGAFLSGDHPRSARRSPRAAERRWPARPGIAPPCSPRSTRRSRPST